jgi:hypothetical protein
VRRAKHAQQYVPARFIQEYLEVLTAANEFQTSNLRNWNLLSCYAELQFKLNGGSKCPLCRAAVRHVVPVIAENTDGSSQEYSCLCTRCFEAERAVHAKLIMQVGEARVEYTPRVYETDSGKTTRFDKKNIYPASPYAC